MAMTNAERQKKYREARKMNVDGKRLDTFVSVDTYHALQRLSARADMTIRETIEKMVLALDKGVIDSLDVHKPEFDEYYDAPKKRRSKSGGKS